MSNFPGFPSMVRSIPVPGPLLGPLLEDITDIAELKCTLRFLWYLAQTHGQPRAVPASVLIKDDVLLAALGSGEAIANGFNSAVRRGMLLTTGIAGASAHEKESAYLLHTPENRKFAESNRPDLRPAKEPQQVPKPNEESINIFVLYEDNIGALTPIIADQLRDAELVYPLAWVKDAFQEAVVNNRRSWRYISRILERWSIEGRNNGTNGEPRRDTEALTATEYLRRYGLPNHPRAH